MNNLISKRIQDNLKAAKADDLSIVKEVITAIAGHNVDMAIADVQAIVTSEQRDKEVVKENVRLTLLLKQHPDQFNTIVNQYIEDLNNKKVAAPENVISLSTLKQLNVLTSKGKLHAQVGNKIASRLSSVAEKKTITELGISTASNRKVGFFAKTFGDSSKFDPNTDKKSRTFGSAEVLDKEQFKNDEDYRNTILAVAKDIKRLKKDATKEQQALLGEVQKLDDKLNERKSSNQTLGGQALLDVGGIIGSGLSKLFSSNRNKAKKQEEESYKTYEKANTTANVVKESPVQVSGRNEEALDMTHWNRNKTKKQEESDEGVSYVMPRDTPKDIQDNSAQIEANDKENDEFRTHEIDIGEKQVTLLEKIYEAVKSGSSSGGGSSMIGSLLTGLLSGLTGMFTSATAKIAEVITSGLAMSKGSFLSLAKTVAGAMAGGYVVDAALGKMGVGGKQIDEAQDDANWQSATFNEKAQSSVGRGIEKLGSAFFLDNLVNEAKATRIKHETAYLDNEHKNDMDYLKAKSDRLNGIKSKQDSSDVNQANKANDALATTISNVSAPNTVISGDSSNQKRGRQITRNPDNSLSLYLQNNVIKFA